MKKMTEKIKPLPQDLHIHTVFSAGDSAVVPQQTLDLIAEIKHAEIIGISDHFDYLTGEVYEKYSRQVKAKGFLAGTEVDGADWVSDAVEHSFDYYIYHCYNHPRDYRAIDLLLETGKPIIIAHPYALDTNLNKIPVECYIEINNRYIWRFDWKNILQDHISRFNFIFSSDAHQPNWLNQNIARYVGQYLGIKETILFSK